MRNIEGNNNDISGWNYCMREDAVIESVDDVDGSCAGSERVCDGALTSRVD